MTRIQLIVFAVALLFSGVAAMAAPPCVADPSGTCAGHKHLTGTTYPYTEDFAPSIGPVVNSGAGYVTVIQGCAARNYVNFDHTQPVNAVLRATVRVKSATAPAGSHFFIRFTIDGTPYGGYIRTLSGNYEQSEEINAIVNVSAGQHKVAVQVLLVDGPGSLTIGNSFLIAQGAPTSTGAASVANGGTITVDNTWRQVSDTISITSATDVHLLVQGYVQVNSGTPGDQLSFGFSLDGASSQRTIDVAVPAYFPSGVNLFDHYKYKPTYITVPAGSHTINIWGVNRVAGHSAVIQHRQVEAIGFEALNDSETLMLEAIETTSKVVTVAGDGTQPFNMWLIGNCGKWTTLLEYSWTYPPPTGTYPHYPAMSGPSVTDGQNWVGEGYIEFTGTSTGQWQTVQVAIEVLNDPIYDSNKNVIGRGTDTDFSILEFKIPPGRDQKFVFTHPVLWGAFKANHIRLLARSFTCFGQAAADFTVGKRYMAIKTIPTTGAASCKYD